MPARQQRCARLLRPGRVAFAAEALPNRSDALGSSKLGLPPRRLPVSRSFTEFARLGILLSPNLTVPHPRAPLVQLTL